MEDEQRVQGDAQKPDRRGTVDLLPYGDVAGQARNLLGRRVRVNC